MPTIPASQYGYWITPDGEFHAVDGLKHVGFAARVLGRPPGGEGLGNLDHRVDLLEQGWTRVAMHSGCFVVQLPPREVANEVLLRLHPLIQQTHQAARLPIFVDDALTGLAAGGRTVRAGDRAVWQAWIRLAAARGVEVGDVT